MTAYEIADGLTVDRDHEEEIHAHAPRDPDGHLLGPDATVRLMRAPIVCGGEVNTWHYWLATNGDPVPVGPCSERGHLDSCAEDLGVSREELERLVVDGGQPAVEVRS